MDIGKVVENIGTAHALKRIASAYVIDYRNLGDAELRAAILKTAPQYYYVGNIRETLRDLFFHSDRTYRILSRLMLREVLLQKDDFTLPMKDTEDEVIAYEQAIIDSSNEDLKKKGGDRTQAVELFQFILEVAWEHNDSISQDEKNLIEKLRARLRMTDTEYQIIEAKLGKYPRPGNHIHTRGDIEEVRRAMQQAGLLFAMRDDDGTDYDVIPTEVAKAVREVLGIEMRRHGYRQLLSHKSVRSKKYYQEMLAKCGITFDKGATIEELQQVFLEQVKPSVLLGGMSPRDGLDTADLSAWCGELGLPVSGPKSDLLGRIIAYYDSLLEAAQVEGDEREIWYRYYEEFAWRKLDFLRGQQLIQKDLECEGKFEAATRFLFEKRLGHTPLKMLGSARADGAVSYQDRVIYWDNKSKGTPVNLADHLRQFDAYIRSSEKPVAGFLVLGPDFTADSKLAAMQYQVENGTTMSMICAEDLKALAEDWHAHRQKGREDPFPLGYLLQPGLFDKDLVAAF